MLNACLRVCRLAAGILNPGFGDLHQVAAVESNLQHADYDSAALTN